MLDGYIGQQDRLTALRTAIKAAQERGGRLPNMLILGRSGLGKTRLANEIANEMQSKLVVMHAPSMIERSEIANKIVEADGGILFIDEIHALNKAICEDMYSVIDNGIILTESPTYETRLVSKYITFEEDLPPNCVEEWMGEGYYAFGENVVVGKVVAERKVNVTIIGATTDESLLPTPFYNRLSQLKVHLREYTALELATIGILYADDKNVNIEYEAGLYLADRALSNPRRMKQLIDRSADYGDNITLGAAFGAVEALGVDELGLEHPHRDILNALAESPDGLSRTSLSQKLGIPPRNLEHYWTDLLRLNLVTIDTRHRITDYGKNHLQGG